MWTEVGYPDGVEIANKTDPLDSEDYPDISTKKNKPANINYPIYLVLGILIIISLFLFAIVIYKKK